MSNQLAAADAAFLVKWRSGRKKDDLRSGKTTFEILIVVKTDDVALKTGVKISLDKYIHGKAGDLFLLTVTKIHKRKKRYAAVLVTLANFRYIVQVPPPDPKQKPGKRLGYFLKFLDSTDPLIASDSHLEFRRASFAEIKALAKRLPREKLRRWLRDSKTPQTRIGLYGLMLGVCGNADDAKLLKRIILARTGDFRLGIDGVISGYLMLTGPKGLDLIDRNKLKYRKTPFSETYAAMLALRFVWTIAGDKIGKERLRQSMRLFLTRPELADLAIGDLRRWKDWSLQDRLMRLYDDEKFDTPAIKRAIVRFMLAGAADVKKGTPVSKLPKHVVKAKANLATLQKKDPKIFRDAKRNFYVE
ncbi:MAG: hypothetical protein IID45_01785 [Planctomycetes bacterium]|nr:hypothetical protein [Planctomycetota bacterium]